MWFPRKSLNSQWLTGGSCVLIDGGLVLLELLDQTLLLWMRKLLKSLFASIFLQKQTKGL